MNSTQEQLIQILKNEIPYAVVGEIGPDTVLKEIIKDSLDFTNVLFSIEETFQVYIADEELQEIVTISEMVVAIQEKQNQLTQ